MKKLAPRPRSRPLLAGVPIPAHVVAYAAGVRSVGAPWETVAEVLVKLRLGAWPVDELQDAVLDWIHEHVEPETGIFTRALCGTA